MNLWESFRVALRALSANKLRSALTMLGIVIGVTAVIALVAAGQGVQASVTDQLRGWGPTCWWSSPDGPEAALPAR